MYRFDHLFIYLRAIHMSFENYFYRFLQFYIMDLWSFLLDFKDYFAYIWDISTL